MCLCLAYNLVDDTCAAMFTVAILTSLCACMCVSVSVDYYSRATGYDAVYERYNVSVRSTLNLIFLKRPRSDPRNRQER